MKIWFIEIGEPLPIEENVRLLRYGMSTRALASYGHDVIWWTSSFSHWARRQICDRDSDFFIDGVKIKVLRGPGYRRNISLQRIIHQRHFAKRFFQMAQRTERPDIMIAPIPTIEAAEAAVRLARSWRIPILIDIRDEWPDEFVDLAPKGLRFITRWILGPYFHRMNFVCNKSTGIISLSKRYLRYGLNFAGRPQGPFDGFFPVGYMNQNLPEAELQKAEEWWKEMGIDKNCFRGCFFGTIGKYFDLETVIKASKILSKELPLQLVLCGNGSNLERYKKFARGNESIIFPGWVDRYKIAALMRKSDFGLAPYAANTRMSLPNKPFEYFAGGLPVVSSIKRELKDILAQNRCGITYQSDDIEGLCMAILRLYKNPEERKEMGQNARSLLEREFAVEKIAHDFEAHLRMVLRHFSLHASISRND